MFASLHKNKNTQIVLGLLFGICFGFLLRRVGVTSYAVIEGQLLLTDFTVLKLMLSAVIFGMAGFHLLRHFGFVQSHAAEGSMGSNVIGGLIFGVGFALLGYCPGTVAGAGVPESEPVDCHSADGSVHDRLFGGTLVLRFVGVSASRYSFFCIKTGRCHDGVMSNLVCFLTRCGLSQKDPGQCANNLF